MPSGNLLIYVSLILTFIGIALSVMSLKTREARFILYSRLNTVLLFTTISVSMIYLYVLFLTSNVSVGYVWSYTKSTHPLIYKVSGVLAGMAGSLLFWIWMMIIPWFYEEMKAIRRPVDRDLMDWTRITMFSIMAVMLFILCLHKLFDPTPANALHSNPDGPLGVN